MLMLEKLMLVITKSKIGRTSAFAVAREVLGGMGITEFETAEITFFTKRSYRTY